MLTQIIIALSYTETEFFLILYVTYLACGRALCIVVHDKWGSFLGFLQTFSIWVVTFEICTFIFPGILPS